MVAVSLEVFFWFEFCAFRHFLYIISIHFPFDCLMHYYFVGLIPWRFSHSKPRVTGYSRSIGMVAAGVEGEREIQHKLRSIIFNAIIFCGVCVSSICVCMMMIIATCEWCVSSIFIYISTYAKHYNTPKLCVGPQMMRNRYADDERMKRYSFLLYPILNNSQQMSFSIRFRPPLTHSERESDEMRKKCIDLLKWTDPLTKMTIDFRSFYLFNPKNAYHSTRATHNDLDLSLSACYLWCYTMKSKVSEWRKFEKWKSNKIQCQLWWAINGNFRFCYFHARSFLHDEMSSILGPNQISTYTHMPINSPFIFVIGLDWFQFCGLELLGAFSLPGV